MTFNINDRVTCRLTPKGHEIVHEWATAVGGRMVDIWPDAAVRVFRDHVNGDEYTSTLWEFAAIFGPHLYNGCVVPTVDNKITIEAQ
jgi:hypothetical protein